MSRVDTQFGREERAAFLTDVKDHLPAFLRAGTVERVDPAGDVRNLLNLSRHDLERVVATHIALSDEVGDFLGALGVALRQPITSSIRPRVATQSVRGLIDWGATIKHRATVGWDESQFVVRPARRIFDTPENRALAWLLDRLHPLMRQVVSARYDERTGVHNGTWLGEIDRRLDQIHAARRHWWLRDVPPERPTTSTLKRLEAARSAIYKLHLPAVIRFLERLTKNPQPDDLVDVLARRYFEPEKDWLLFEVAVALRVAREFARLSSGLRRARLLVGIGASPYAIYQMPDASEVRLWYQAWPTSAEPSLQTKARKRYGIQAGPVRPDLIIEHVAKGATTALLLELKASRSAEYLASGLFQLMGYLKDRPALFTKPTPAWLVAPPSNAFTTVPPDDLQLWAVDSDHVASEAAHYFGFEETASSATA